MAKGTNQKLKMLFLAKLFTEQTDEQHGVTISDIIDYLSANDINADRKTLYLDIEELRHFGLDIIGEKHGKSFIYYLGSHDFELPELKLLVDSVQAARFITEKKSQTLIKKLEALTSRYEALKLNREVITAGRVKAMNESIYYNVDKLHDAIGSDSAISFQYFQWNVKKEAELRHGGASYSVSPWALLCDSENYYLIGYDNNAGAIKHYRVDKMLNISLTGEKRSGKADFDKINLSTYTSQVFRMFSGETAHITVEAEDHLAGVLIDRLGKDIIMYSIGNGRFRASFNVALSGQFIGWIISLGSGIRIISPDSAVDMMKATLKELGGLYG